MDYVDILLIDVQMPILDRPSTMASFRTIFNDTNIILDLSVDKEARLVSEMIKKGANGYITKGVSSEELFKGMRKVLKTGFYLSRDVAEYFKKSQTIEFKEQKLTEKEQVILKLICIEKNNQEIAKLLSISRNTVNTYRTRMLEKLKANNTVGLVMYALKSGLCWIDEND